MTKRKKTLAWLLALVMVLCMAPVLSLGALAATDGALLEVDFKSELPADWLNVDEDGNDSGNWMHVALGDNGYMASASDDLLENWLITPELELDGLYELTYYMAVEDSAAADETWGVYISTKTLDTTADPLDLSGFEKLDEFTAKDEWTKYTVDLSAYDGETVRIAFVHKTSTNATALKLDDVLVAPIPVSATPTVASAAYTKTTAAETTATFTLTNGSAYAGDLDWKVYDAETGDTPLTDVSASASGDTLTLTGVAETDYWVCVTEEGKLESARLKLTVAPVPTYSVTDPDAKTVKGVTAAVTASPASSVTADTSVTATVTLSGTTAQSGTYTVGLTSASASITAPETQTYTAAAGTGADGTTFAYTFNMPAGAVSDLSLTLSFKPDAPAAAFSASGADSGTLSGVASGMQYSLDGGTSWNSISDSSVSLTGVTAANGIQIKWPADAASGVLESDVQTIVVTQAQRPNLTPVQPTAADGKGTLALSDGMEYKLTSSSDWTSASGTVELSQGSYDVRVKASGTVLASETQTVTIAYTAPEKTTAPTVSDTTYTKTAATNATATFTLTNSPAYGTGTWKVYAAQTGDTLASGVTASSSGSTLTLTHATDVPVGSYWVSFTEDGKTESDRLQLTVSKARPVISTQPQNLTAAAGGTATFTVQATGIGTLTYQWQMLSPGESDWKVVQHGSSASYTTGVLAAADNGAKFRCAVVDANDGATYSETVTLTVTGTATSTPTATSTATPSASPKAGTTPETGDTANPILWLIIVVVVVAGIVVAIIILRKKQNAGAPKGPESPESPEGPEESESPDASDDEKE